MPRERAVGAGHPRAGHAIAPGVGGDRARRRRRSAARASSPGSRRGGRRRRSRRRRWPRPPRTARRRAAPAPPHRRSARTRGGSARTCEGWISILPAKPSRRAWRALGQEPLARADVDERPVERRPPLAPRAPPAPATSAPAAAPRRRPTCRSTSMPRSSMKSTNPKMPVSTRSLGGEDLGGAVDPDRRLDQEQHRRAALARGPWPRSAAVSHSAAARTVSALSTLGSTMPSRFGCMHPVDVSLGQTRARMVDAHVGAHVGEVARAQRADQRERRPCGRW